MYKDYIQVDDLKTIQQLLYMTLKEFHEICEKNNLKYSLDYGSLIGAVRHHAIIPWDDDVDVCMPRPDFEKLINLVKSNYSDKYILKSPKDENYIYPYGKFGFKNTRLVEKVVKEPFCNLFLYIDVYPMDAASSDIDYDHKLFAKYKALIEQSTYKKRYFLRIYGLGRGAIYSLHSFFLNKNYKYYQNKELEIMNNTNYVSNDLILNKADSHAVVVNKSFFDNRILTNFGNYKIWITKEYDKYLTGEFGNYMQLPPEDERVCHHNYDLYVDRSLLS